MRTLLLTAVGLILYAPTTFAQSSAYLAETIIDNVVIRSGPGEQMPETGTLPRGSKVVVDHEEGDLWLAIQPPRGQVSWIKHLFLGPVEGQPTDRFPRNAVVHSEQDVEIAFGKTGATSPLDVRRTKIPDGAIVLIIGPAIEYQSSKWYPIEPPDGDFRYVPKSSVQISRGRATEVFSVKSPILTAPAANMLGKNELTSEFTASSQSAVAKPTPTHPIWLQAEAAEASGDFAKAESLYIKLATEMNQTGGDLDLANMCFSRVHAVRERQRQQNRSTIQGVLTGNSRQAGTSPSVVPSGSHSTPSDENQPSWVGPGTLRLAGFRYDGKTTYALEDGQGRVKCYAIEGQGVNLDKQRGTEVELYGKLTTSKDLRGVGVMTVDRIRSTRDK